MNAYVLAALISALFTAAYTIYVAASALALQLSTPGRELGLLDAFTEGAVMIEGFWPHVLAGWATSAALAFVSCVTVLLFAKR